MVFEFSLVAAGTSAQWKFPSGGTGDRGLLIVSVQTILVQLAPMHLATNSWNPLALEETACPLPRQCCSLILDLMR